MRAVCLISGGIDSPVAAYLAARAGAEVILLHMDNRPFADDRQMENVKAVAEQLRKATGQEMPLYAAPHGKAQEAIMRMADRNYQCVLCKHAMHVAAGELCRTSGAKAVVMGDSLGQVASQTLDNIAAESTGIDFLILRPLIGYDKLEIEAIAKGIGTYGISILPAVGCTALPGKVVVTGSPEKVRDNIGRCGLDAVAREVARKTVRISRSVTAAAVERGAPVDLQVGIQHVHGHRPDVRCLDAGDVQRVPADGYPQIGFLGPLHVRGYQGRARAGGADAVIVVLGDDELPHLVGNCDPHGCTIGMS